MHAPGDSLSRQLAMFKEGFVQRLAPDERRIVLDANEATAQQALHQRHVGVGEPAPDFTLPDQHGRPIRLSEQLTYGPVILLFVGGSWSPFCALALRSYQNALSAIHDAGGSIMAITAEPPHRCSSMAERDLLAFPILSDADSAVAEAYGVSYDVPPDLRALYAKWGQDVPRLNKSGDWRIPRPATYVVGQGGRAAIADVPSTVYTRLEPASVVEMLESMQVNA